MSMLDHVASQRIAKGAAATLTATITDADGEADQSLDTGVTVTVTNLAGTAVATAQSATCTNGVATYTLTGSQTSSLDILTAAWTSSSVVRATTYHEIVGRHWFAPSALRAIEGVDAALATPPGGMGTQALIDARTWIEQLIEWATGVAWVPRTALDYLTSDGRGELALRHKRPRSITSITVDGTAETVADYVADEWGTLRREAGGSLPASEPRGFVVRYEHGFDAPPAPLVEAAMIAAADRIKSRISTLGNRLTGISGEFGTISYARIDAEHPTGIPAVDATIMAYSHRTPGIA